MSSASHVHHTAGSAQDTFYQALADGDIDTLMSVWVHDESVLCILPSGERLAGLDAIRETHEDIFSRGGVRVGWQEIQSFETGTVSVHHVLEQFEIDQPHEMPQSFVTYATNVFLRTPQGWQIILHHASQATDEPEIHTLQPEYLH